MKEPLIVYIQPEPSCEVGHEDVCIGDVSDVYCKDAFLKEKIKAMVFMHVTLAEEKNYAVSSMALIACIDKNAQLPVLIQNTGAAEFIISTAKKPDKKPVILGKVLVVTFITFFGSIFAIMTYNEDVAVTGVFDKLYEVVMGYGRSAPGLLEAAYAVGVAFGVILFFNHFGKHKLTKEPTPMEIEMEKYETDITDTLVKKASRKDDIFNGDSLDPAKEKGGSNENF